MVTTTSTSIDDDLVAQARRLMDDSFDDFSDHDWQHALGGVHTTVVDDGVLLAHASLVPRTIRVADADLRCGYVEAVATRSDRRREGLGAQVMAALEARAGDYDALFLCASASAVPFYLARGWRCWRGPAFVLMPEGPARTPEEDGAIYVWHADLDLDAPIACDWREGDVW